MRIIAVIISVILLLGSFHEGRTQPYDLKWKHRNVRAQDQSAPKPPVPRDDLPYNEAFHQAPVEPGPSKSRTQPASETEKEPVKVQIIAEQSYDHYEERYRKVSKVEYLVYRGGYPEDEVLWNQADYDSFDVWIDDLQPGDRYKVRVTWDDDSHRTEERTIGNSPDLKVWISEPLAFDEGFES